MESKWELYNEVKKCGFKNTIVASFSHMTRVDDVFIKQLVEKGEDREGLFGFSEITDGMYFITIRVCGKVIISVRSVCSDYNFLTSIARNFIFSLQIHLDHI